MFRLQSDFSDYYDSYSDSTKELVYLRNRSGGLSRGEALNYLRQNGIKTVEFGMFSKFNRNTKSFVVYTNSSLHNFLGKHIYSYNEVYGQYKNCVVSEFLEVYGGYTVKYLQIGERRFRIMFFNSDFKTKLVEGNVVNVEELPKQYNYAIGIPIYSIDYVSNGIEMVAVDFNEVQHLESIGMKKLITAEDVATEIKKSLIAYNKA